ncbi:MAG: BlaI/MecI/CopY family transcriptional regulator [Alteraurantiacibacter sp.]|nr:BlaI/MecI/CopY family transcriptional regulator [Alteraurantiacibacter sp.]
MAPERHQSEADRGSSERISEAEHAVMEVLWRGSPLSASDVYEALREDRGWTLPTVKTLLSRLVNKGALDVATQGRRFLYTPRIARKVYVGKESRRLVDRLFGGRAAPLFAHLAENEQLTNEDIAEIARLLEELRK